MAKDMVVVDHKQFLDMVGELPFSAKQVNMLLQKTPLHLIKERAIPGGGTAKYVATQYMINTLNLIAGFRWDFDVIEETEKHGQIIIRGKLTVTCKDGQTISKTQYGRALIKMKKTGGALDYGNDAKAAASDALKKCASLLGIAWDVYSNEDLREIQIMDSVVVESNHDAAEAERLAVPLGQIQADVRAKLPEGTSDRMRVLKEHTGKLIETKLTEHDWRTLHQALSALPAGEDQERQA